MLSGLLTKVSIRVLQKFFKAYGFQKSGTARMLSIRGTVRVL